MKLLNQPLKYYPFLDGFRAYAVAWVFLHHVSNQFPLRMIFGDFYPIFIRFAFPGFLGVDMFFVISGFLITGLLLDDFKEGKIRIKRFYGRRFLKIVPHYFFVLACGIVLVSTIGPQDPHLFSGIGYHLFFLQNYLGKTILSLAHTWSLAVEEHYYLLYPLLLAGIAAIGKKSGDRLKILAFVLVGLIGLGIFLRVYTLQGVNYIRAPVSVQVTHLRFDALICGCLIRLLEPALAPAGGKRDLLSGGGYFIAGLALYGLALCITASLIPAWLFYTVAYAAPACWLIAGLKNFPLIRMLTEPRAIRAVGRNSYGIYLWHYLLIPSFAQLNGKVSLEFAVLAYSLATLALGFLTTATVERYALSLRRKFS